VLAIKSVWQYYVPERDVLRLLELFRRMVNEALRIGIANDASSLRKLSLLSYNQLAQYDSPSYYKLCAISRAAGILAARKKSIMRGFHAREPYAVRSQFMSCYGFKIKNGGLEIPISRGRRLSIALTKHTQYAISQAGVTVRSFTLTRTRLSLCIARDTPTIECNSTTGVDRNLRNLTVGNDDKTHYYDTSETMRIAKVTTRIIHSFKRNDIRIRKVVASKYGRRRATRTRCVLHNVTKKIIAAAVQERTAIVLENISGIRSLYRKGNGQGPKYRCRMNQWSFGEAQRQIEYKARWVGLPVIRLYRRETRGSSVTCPRCGERLQSDRNHMRELWCWKCENWMDRDVVAAVNISWRGRLRFDRSKGGAVEAVKGNPTPTVIPGVDAPKLASPSIS